MGAEVQGLSLDPQVARRRGHSPEARFGSWLLEQRQLRGLSRGLVAARTRIAEERIEAIERGRIALGDDALGRGTVRQLTLAIDADPDQAFECLGWRDPVEKRLAQGTSRRPAAVWAWAGGVAGLVVMAALAWSGARWLARGAEPADASIVYRPDYVDDLLTRPDDTRGS